MKQSRWTSIPSDPLTSQIRNRSSPRFGFVERVQVLAERGNDALVFVGIFAENVLDDDDGFLDDVVDFSLDQIEQSRDASFGRRFNLIERIIERWFQVKMEGEKRNTENTCKN